MDYKIQIANFENKISRANVSQTVDETSVMKISLVDPKEKLSQKELSFFPEEASFHWNNKGVFKGHLLSKYSLHDHTVELTYVDKLFLSKKIVLNTLFKKQSLEDAIKKIVRPLGMSVEFKGSFSSQVPAFQQGGKDCFSLLSILSNEYGFYFFEKSIESKLVFIRAGKELGTQEPNKNKIIQAHYSDSALYVKNEVSLKESAITGMSLYAPVDSFMTNGAKKKINFKNAQATSELSDNKEISTEDLKYKLSKQVMSQDSIKITSLENIATLGQKIKTKQGEHFITAINIDISSSKPKLTLTGTRP
jgi:hypothetical protein